LGAVVGCPANQAVLVLLGEVLFEMGDLPEAGRYWYLTERAGPEVEAATEALLERFGRSPHELGRSLPLVAPVAAYPDVVQARLGRLPEEVLRRRERRPLLTDHGGSWFGRRAAGIVGPVVGMVFIGLLGLGLYKLIELVGSLLG
jgi:hypothetical protein